MPAPPEQEIAIPPRPVILAIVVACAVSAALGAALAELTPDPSVARWVMPLGSLAVGTVTAASALLFVTAMPRPAGLCGSFWLGATLIRFVAVPGICLFIYWSAPSVGLPAAVAAVGSYLACLAAETATVVRLVHRSL